MPASAYRITLPIAAVIREGTREILQMLPPGCILIPTLVPGRSGMIEALCDGNPVRVFQRDLEERAYPIEAEPKTA